MGRPVVVMGVSGSGKSTVGAALASNWGVEYADGDDLHPAANIAKMRSGLALDDHDRAGWLDRVAAWLAEHPDGGVIACSALRRRYRERLLAAQPRAWFLELDAGPEVLAERLRHREAHFMPASLLGSQLATLEPLAADEPGERTEGSLAQILAAHPEPPT